MRLEFYDRSQISTGPENFVPGPLLQLWSGSVSSSSRAVPPQHLSPPSSYIPKHLSYIILPRLERIHTRIRILFRRIVNEQHKIFDVKNIRCFDMAGQLHLVCISVDLLHDLNKANLARRQLVLLSNRKMIFS